MSRPYDRFRAASPDENSSSESSQNGSPPEQDESAKIKALRAKNEALCRQLAEQRALATREDDRHVRERERRVETEELAFLLEKMVVEAYDELRAAGLLNGSASTIAFEISRAGDALLKALPARRAFTMDEAFEAAEAIGLAVIDAGRYATEASSKQFGGRSDAAVAAREMGALIELGAVEAVGRAAPKGASEDKIGDGASPARPRTRQVVAATQERFSLSSSADASEEGTEEGDIEGRGDAVKTGAQRFRTTGTRPVRF